MPATQMPRLTLILGGARSGKSRRARTLAEGSGLAPVIIATAQAGDEEMAERISRHKSERSTIWTTVEESLDLIGALHRQARPGRCLVVDCATLWLANLLFAEGHIEQEAEALVTCLQTLECPCILVSNEVGWGVVPANELARLFRDIHGRLNQQLASICDHVDLVVAGIPVRIKPERN